MIMLILNGKKAGLPQIRETVLALRAQGHKVEVRCTWEGGDVKRFVKEASNLGITRVIAGGGDGTVNEVAEAIVQLSPADPALELAILPLGTANDFASACLIPTEIESALALAVNGNAVSIDMAKANERHFINVASAGFGAKVTVDTPVELKDLLGGQAYFLSGLVQALNFTPYQGQVSATLANGDKVDLNGEGLLGAICNGRLAGGGQNLAPNALLNDGLLDVLLIKHFPTSALKQVVDELKQPLVNAKDVDGKHVDDKYVNRMQVTEITLTSTQSLPVNLDGEPTSYLLHHIKVLPKAIKLVCPENCPVLIQD
ncbi:lipid kinase YegS [Shewanella sp. 125m-7]